LGEEKFKYASFVEENGFGSAHLPCLPWLVKEGTSRVHTW
jgi:hypothetical protein